MPKLLLRALLSLFPCLVPGQTRPVQQVLPVRAGIGPAMRAGHSHYSAFSDMLETTSAISDAVLLKGHEQFTAAEGTDAGPATTRRYTDVWRRNQQGARRLIARQATYPAHAAEQLSAQSPVSCKPLAEKTGETGCWILGSERLGPLTGPVYWTLDTFATRELAQSMRTSQGMIFESLGKIWLLTVGAKPDAHAAATRVAVIGPFAINAGEAYMAQFMEATLEPGMVSRTHLHSGLEVFYTQSGETCLETPAGRQLGKPGTNLMVPEGIPMELTAVGTETRRGLMLILHDASKPPTRLVEDWRSQGLCKATLPR